MTGTGGGSSAGGGTASAGGGSDASGGGAAATGGGSAATGGGSAATGGGSAATGGGSAAMGGGSAATGGGSAATGGGSVAAGGGSHATGGGAAATGGGSAAPDAGTGGSAHAGFNPPFPRIASYRIGGSQIYDAAFQTWASKQAVVIIGGNWEGWSNSSRKREDVVHSIKSQSTLGTIVLQYGDDDAVATTGDNMPGFTPKIASNNWYLWNVGTSGTHAVASSTPSFWQTNVSSLTARDSLGHRLEAAFIIYQDAQYRTGGGINAAPSLDGHFHDNMLFYSRVNGDFDGNGTTDVGTDYGPQWRTGIRAYFDQLEAIDPNVIRFGNLDDMYALSITDPTNTAAAAPLNGILH